MKKVYICSRYAGKVEENIEEARKFANYCFKKGNLPICVHLFLNEITEMNEREGNRKRLLKVGRDYLKMTEEIWVLEINGISEGMMMEIKEAVRLGLEIKNFKKGGKGGYKKSSR